jgi:hypothetical protein
MLLKAYEIFGKSMKETRKILCDKRQSVILWEIIEVKIGG